jgi:hypothetical protein
MSTYLKVQQQAIERVVSKASVVDHQSVRPTKKGGQAGRRLKSIGALNRASAQTATNAG